MTKRIIILCLAMNFSFLFSQTTTDEVCKYKVQISAKFKGNWEEYLAKAVAKYDTLVVTKKESINVEFIVDKSGKVSSIKALNGSNCLRKIAEDIIAKSGDWIPAQIDNKSVKAYKIQKIVFLPTENTASLLSFLDKPRYRKSNRNSNQKRAICLISELKNRRI